MSEISINHEPEFWLSGPIPGISIFLQPTVHALLQSRRELAQYTMDFPEALLWEKTVGRASVGFHMQHLTGVLDRMLTYARSKPLTIEQFQYLKSEGSPNTKASITELVESFNTKVDEALEFCKTIPDNELTHERTVGRKKLPSTVLGLLFHAAEHSQRHVGQLLVTVSVLIQKL
ncbi:DinB family protein [Sediminicola arcticus]|jgi:uncharacterized damage-inducible protein DinB|uniref:DinB family protein n=1 Tax=Sediminicola arcticus TaxID=1574308 RepID=A0ABV2SXY5_9FLAO